jgi:hypothetical protein
MAISLSRKAVKKFRKAKGGQTRTKAKKVGFKIYGPGSKGIRVRVDSARAESLSRIESEQRRLDGDSTMLVGGIGA